MTANGVGTCGADDNQAQAGHLVVGVLGEHAHTLTAEGADAGEDGTGRGTPIVTAFHLTQDPISGPVAPAMGTGNAQGCATVGVSDGVIVRRLTPLECERLQGFPDGWTAIDGASDSQRYRQMGNSVAVPVFEWVLNRLAAADEAVA